VLAAASNMAEAAARLISFAPLLIGWFFMVGILLGFS
jgi:hypothetical protein